MESEGVNISDVLCKFLDDTYYIRTCWYWPDALKYFHDILLLRSISSILRPMTLTKTILFSVSGEHIQLACQQTFSPIVES